MLLIRFYHFTFLPPDVTSKLLCRVQLIVKKGNKNPPVLFHIIMNVAIMFEPLTL